MSLLVAKWLGRMRTDTWHAACFTPSVMRFSALLLCLAAVGACATLEEPGDGGGDPLRPQPLPEPSRYPTLEPSLVHLQHTAAGLEVTGGAGAADGSDVRIVVTELRRGAPLLEVAVAEDLSFSVQLDAATATDVQLSPVAGAALGESLVLRIDQAGRVTELPAPCVSSTSGLWPVGYAESGSTPSESSLTLQNHCDVAVTVDALALRSGREFTLEQLALPVTVQPGAALTVNVQFVAATTSVGHATARYDVVDIETTPATGRALVLRAFAP